MLGRTADTSPGVKLRAEKCRKISADQDLQLYMYRKSGILLKEAQSIMNLNHLHYQTIVTASKRGQRMFEKTMAQQLTNEMKPDTKL
jgi:hypothetical protein